MNYFLEERFYINDKNFYKGKNIRHIGTTETDKKTTYYLFGKKIEKYFGNEYFLHYLPILISITLGKVRFSLTIENVKTFFI